MRNSTAHADVSARTGATSEPKTGLLARVTRALAMRRERRALLALDDRMLADVGLSRTDAYREAHRPFMDLPSTYSNMSLR